MRLTTQPSNRTARDHADAVAASLAGIARSVIVVELPGLPPKGDVSDWLDGGGTASELRRLISEATHRPTHPPQAGGEPGGRAPRGALDATKNGSEAGGLKPGGSQLEPGGSTEESRGVRGVHPFPTHVFPKALAEFITSTSSALPCPPEFVGAPMLAVMASVIGRHCCIEVKPGWIEFLVLWIAVVGRSGDKKSPSPRSLPLF